MDATQCNAHNGRCGGVEFYLFKNEANKGQ